MTELCFQLMFGTLNKKRGQFSLSIYFIVNTGNSSALHPKFSLPFLLYVVFFPVTCSLPNQIILQWYVIQVEQQVSFNHLNTCIICVVENVQWNSDRALVWCCPHPPFRRCAIKDESAITHCTTMPCIYGLLVNFAHALFTSLSGIQDWMQEKKN